jgi:hypothetical protein
MLLAGAFLLLSVGTPALASTTWNIGDLFLGVANGSYQVRDQAGALKETLTTGRGGFTTGCAFDAADNLYGTEFSANNVSVFQGPNAPHTNSLFGGGYSTPEMVAFDAAGNVYVGNLGDGIHQYTAAGIFVKKIIAGVRVDFFDIAADQDTILFGQEGADIKTASIASGLQGANFSTGTATQAFAMRILPDGGLLLADLNNIKRYDAAGVVIDTYDATGENSWFSLNLDPDGTSFWAGNFNTASYYKFDIGTGGLDNYIAGPFNTGTGGGSLFGMCLLGEPTVVQRDPIEIAKTYRHTNTCFERDNDIDGRLSEDPMEFGDDGVPLLIDNDDDGLVDEDASECPDGTNPGDIIDNDDDGTYFVDSVLKKNGSVSSYNPGQLYAVATINVLSDIDRLILGEFYDDCTLGADDLLDLNPANGGGRAKVVVEHDDGTLEQVWDANTDDPHVVFISDEENTIAVLLHSFAAGDIVHLYVKFGPGADSSGDGSCVNAAAGVVPNDDDPFVVIDTATLVVTPK